MKRNANIIIVEWSKFVMLNKNLIDFKYDFGKKNWLIWYFAKTLWSHAHDYNSFDRKMNVERQNVTDFCQDHNTDLMDVLETAVKENLIKYRLYKKHIIIKLL